MEFDSVQIGVADLDVAVQSYRRLLRVDAAVRTAGGVRFQLERGAVELEPGELGVRSIRFVPSGDRAASAGAAPAGPVAAAAFNGLTVHLDAAALARPAPARPVPAPAVGRDGVLGLDHVVVHSPNLDRAIALWRDRLGLRLALDREFPMRGLRMLFFRSAGVTLEFVGSLPAPVDAAGPDRFYGIAYRVSDLESCRARLLADGVDVTPVRPGHKPGTVVATVRSGTEGLPTLLIGELGNIRRSG